jgi:dihydroorotase
VSAQVSGTRTGARNKVMAKPSATLIQRDGDAADLLIRGARVLDPRSDLDEARDVVVRGGEIAELAEPGAGAEPDGAEVVNGEGMLVLPAFVDPHVHFRVPGQEHKEDLETGTRAAAAGGYCAVIAMANTSPPVDSAAVLGSVRDRAEREASVPVGFIANVTQGMAGNELTEMAEMREAGAIAFSDDGLPIRSARVLRRALQYQRLCGGVIALHEEDPELSGDGVMHEGEVSAVLGLAGVPSVSESTMIARDCSLALYEDARIHVQHLSARSSVEEIARAKAAGVQVTCEASPHHLTLTDEEVRSLDSRFKMNPPLRTEDDRQALIEGLRDGTIDCVATDHAPHAPEEKEVPFEQAAMGVTGLEQAFAVLHTDLVLPGVLPLETLVERMTSGGEPFGIPAPRIEPGAVANLVLIDPASEWVVGEDGYESRAYNSCFAGRTLTGRVLMTVAAGQVAFRQRSFAMGVA